MTRRVGLISDFDCGTLFGKGAVMTNGAWNTPFGKVLILASIVSAVLGFSFAFGVAGYFRSAMDTDQSVPPDALSDESLTVEQAPLGDNSYQATSDLPAFEGGDYDRGNSQPEPEPQSSEPVEGDAYADGESSAEQDVTGNQEPVE